ncbi:MAG: helix-turn-helix transcriptional regulator [Clostridiales bacterium]|nr:helix-turn-helix transcriptional regulator [Clostridiales bacterium]
MSAETEKRTQPAYYRRLATRLKNLRKETRWLQSEAASRLGVDTRTYAAYELGRSQPSPYRILTLARMYGVTTDYLLENYADSPETVWVPPTAEDGEKQG